VEALVVLCAIPVSRGFPRDARHHLCDQDKVDNEWRCQKRILANVEQTKPRSEEERVNQKKECMTKLTRLSGDHP
jgi:hypothetical protein